MEFTGTDDRHLIEVSATDVEIRLGRSPAACDLTRTVSWIEQNLDTQITVDAMAQMAGASKWNFSRLFKSRFKQPPHAYLLKRRLMRSQQMLADERLTLSQIAYDCGFSSQSHLTTAFKRYFGVTPGRYRRLQGY